MSLNGQVAFITGCSDGGIGSALAKTLHERGYHVFAGVRDIAKASSLKDLTHVTPVILDMTKPDQIEAAAEQVANATGGKLDVLINNAATNNFMPLLDENLESIRGLFEVNFIGPIAITQAFAPLLIKVRLNGSEARLLESGTKTSAIEQRTSSLHHVYRWLRQHSIYGYESS